MNCLTCGAKMKTQKKDVPYTACGLSHVTLRNIEVSRCSQCGEEEITIPRIEALHQTIAQALIAKPSRLNAEEIRYLRKYLDWSEADFAAHMGTTRETVMRWEKAQAHMGAQADRLLRLMIATKGPVRDYSLATLRAISTQELPRVFHLGLTVEHEEWQAEAA